MPAFYVLVSEACLLHCRIPGSCPFAILQQHSLHACSGEVLERQQTAALAGLPNGYETASFGALPLEDRQKCLPSVQTVTSHSSD